MYMLNEIETLKRWKYVANAFKALGNACRNDTRLYHIFRTIQQNKNKKEKNVIDFKRRIFWLQLAYIFDKRYINTRSTFVWRIWPLDPPIETRNNFPLKNNCVTLRSRMFVFFSDKRLLRICVCLEGLS